MNKYISECDKTFIGRPGYTIETWSSEKLNQQRSKDVAPSTEAAHLLTHTPPVTTCLLAFTGSCSIKQADQETFLQIRNTYLWEPSLIAIFTYFPAVRIRKEVQIGLWEPPTTIQNYTGQLFWFQKVLDLRCWMTIDFFNAEKLQKTISLYKRLEL